MRCLYLALAFCATVAGASGIPAFVLGGDGGGTTKGWGRAPLHHGPGPKLRSIGFSPGTAALRENCNAGTMVCRRNLIGGIEARKLAVMSQPKRGLDLRAALDDDEASEERAKPLEERKEQLRVLLSASKKDIDKLVRNTQSVLTRLDIEEHHGKKLALLQERIGIEQKAAGRLCLNANRLLTFSFQTLETRIDWLQAKLKINKTQLRTIITRSPNVLTYSIEDNLEPTIDSIQSSLELRDKELTKMIVRNPDLLTYNMSAENIKQRFSFLREVLDLPEGDVASLRKYIMRVPDILVWHEDSMKESQQWVKQRFGLGDARVAQMCRNAPGLFYANTTTLSDKADSIQSELSLSEEELSNLVSKFSTIFYYNIDKGFRPKLQYLRTRLELDEEALKNLGLKAPSLFSYSEGNIEEKLQFYSNLVGEREAKRMVVKSSNLLKQSLKKRLKPRLAEVQKSGVKIKWTETLIQRLATRTDDLWERYKLGDTKKGRPSTNN